MKPVSEKAFCKILDSYIVQIDEVVSPATLLTLENISSDTNPEEMCVDDFDDFIEDWIRGIYEWTLTIEGLKNYLSERINNESGDEGLAFNWSIGDVYEIEGESYFCKYKDEESFSNDVDFDSVIQIVKKCWVRACKTDAIFSEEEVINDYYSP